MAAYTILLEASGNGTLTPKFSFPSGTIEVEIDDVSDGFLTSGVEGSIAVTTGQKVEYICSDWDVITRIEIQADPVSGDISGWTLPNTLVNFNIHSTSLSGDISGWTLPNTLETFYIYSTSLSYASPSGAFTGITAGLVKIDFDDCALDSWQVDRVLKDLVDSGISGKALDIGGNNSGPSPVGKQNLDALVADGWSIASTTKLAFPAALWTATDF